MQYRFLNAAAYERLKAQILQNKENDPERANVQMDIFVNGESAFRSYIAYVTAYNDAAREFSSGGEESRTSFYLQDELRHQAHELAINYVRILNRMSTRYGIDRIYIGDENKRYEVADFCAEVSDYLKPQNDRL